VDTLEPAELRVLGCLVEKEHTTPDQYPLTLNGLVLACNQTSNRQPVVAYDEETVRTALASLRQRKLARTILAPGNRATKYRHVLDEATGLTPGECAILAVLALRGPQTASELRARTERYRGVEDLGGVESVLSRLADRYEEPYVRRLERQPGQREERWAQLLGGEPPPAEAAPLHQPAAGSATLASRLSALEQEVAALKAEVVDLRRTLA
jgi:uncharacterized protein YceH (UPF0502 family)